MNDMDESTPISTWMADGWLDGCKTMMTYPDGKLLESLLPVWF
jgi:hypothetical protein